GGRGIQRTRIRGARGLNGRLNPAARACDLLVRDPAQPLFELLDPIPAVDEVGMAIDEAGRQPLTAAVLDRNALLARHASGLGGRADPRDVLAPYRERC